MIKPEKITEVKKLLDEGNLSHREIAKATGVYRHLITDIESGEYDKKLEKKLEAKAMLGANAL